MLTETVYNIMYSNAPELTVPAWLDLSSVIVGAFSGVLASQERKLDLVGTVAVCLMCGLGGGLIRDVILQTGSVYMLQSRWAIAVALLAGAFGFAFPGLFRRFPNLFEWVDILSVALFVCAGTDKAIVSEQLSLACVLMGVITGVGGGMLRDVFLGEVPRVFVRSHFYALCAVGGAVAYLACVRWLGLARAFSAIVSIVVTVTLRRISLGWDIKSPSDVDLTPALYHSASKVATTARDIVHREYWRSGSDATGDSIGSAARSRGDADADALQRRNSWRRAQASRARRSRKAALPHFEEAQPTEARVPQGSRSVKNGPLNEYAAQEQPGNDRTILHESALNESPRKEAMGRKPTAPSDLKRRKS